jgi:hypothetical protein
VCIEIDALPITQTGPGQKPAEKSLKTVIAFHTTPQATFGARYDAYAQDVAGWLPAPAASAALGLDLAGGAIDCAVLVALAAFDLYLLGLLLAGVLGLKGKAAKAPPPLTSSGAGGSPAKSDVCAVM